MSNVVVNWFILVGLIVGSDPTWRPSPSFRAASFVAQSLVESSESPRAGIWDGAGGSAVAARGRFGLLGGGPGGDMSPWT